MIQWVDEETGEGRFESVYFCNDEGQGEMAVYADSSIPDFKECAERCVEKFNRLPDTAVREICEQLIGCAAESGREDLPSPDDPREILESCWFVALYADMAGKEDEVGYVVEGEGDWGEAVGFAVHDGRVTYVGPDYLDAMEHPY